MSQSEVEQYQFQLDQVELALVDSPDDEELLKLKGDLLELIALTTQFDKGEEESAVQDETKAEQPPKQQQAQQAQTSKIPAPTALKTQQYHVGQEVKAKWSQDGNFYRAIITAIGGADQVFSVRFKGYKDIEVVPVTDIQPLEKDQRRGIFENIKGVPSSASPSPSPAPKRAASDDTKPKKDTKKQKKAHVADVKKNAWLNFATKDKKGKRKSAINTKSIFRTPDSLDSKVGVVGSGRGMTDYQQRGKHSFQATGEDDLE
ncbi:hypothetical protein BC940DRAFT_330943 [Gongronella butleri]|nr:hypothetical protein BC940DRAFT_330943 [Gongronella butleri]